MKNRVMMLLLSALGASACSNASQNFYIQEMMPVTCTEPSPEVFISSGSLDVASGGAQFFVWAYISSLDSPRAPAVELGSYTLEAEGRNTPLVTTQTVTYKLSKRLGATPKPYITSRATPFIDGKVTTRVQLISPDLATLLFDSLTPTNDLEDFVDITAEVEFSGEFSATKSPFRTGVFSFPIRAYRSNPTASCTAPTRFLRIDPTTCRYVGQTDNSADLALPPTTCCTPGVTPGC